MRRKQDDRAGAAGCFEMFPAFDLHQPLDALPR